MTRFRSPLRQLSFNIRVLATRKSPRINARLSRTQKHGSSCPCGCFEEPVKTRKRKESEPPETPKRKRGRPLGSTGKRKNAAASVKTAAKNANQTESKVSNKAAVTPSSRSPKAALPKSSGRKVKTNRRAQKPTVQFDYGVPSPIEEERDSVDDDDAANQSQAEAKKSSRVIIARTKEGHSIHIPLDPPKPFVFKSEKARKLWEASTEERGNLIKKRIESRDLVPDWLKRQLEGTLELTKAQTRDILTEDKSRRSGEQGLQWLRLEGMVLDVDADIKSCLSSEFADLDLDGCISSLEKLVRIQVDPLMLKKYPTLAETPSSLQRYQGFLTRWRLSDEQTEIFCNKRAIIWEKAKSLQLKYMALLGITDFDKYTDEFQQRLHTFLNAVVDLTEDEISLLTHEPSVKKPARNKTST